MCSSEPSAAKKSSYFKRCSIPVCSDNLDSVETRVLYWPGQIAALRETGQRAKKPQKPWTIWTFATSLHPAQMKRQSELPAFFWLVMSVQSWTWLVALDWSPGLFPFSSGTELIAVPVYEGANPAYPMHSLLLPSSFTSCFHWLLACLVWQLPEHTDLKMSSKCPVQPLHSTYFRITSSFFGFLRTTLLFLFPNCYHSQFSSLIWECKT